MKNPEKTFNWIVDVFRKHNVSFVVTGGLAAKSYGSPRSLNDIDIDIRDENFALILEDIRPYIVFGPVQYRDERWDLLLATLDHEGQEIDIGGGDTVRICDVRTGEWKSVPTDFLNIEQREVLGVKVPVISRTNLITYKSMLQGEHQQIDIQAAQSSSVQIE